MRRGQPGGVSRARARLAAARALPCARGAAGPPRAAGARGARGRPRPAEGRGRVLRHIIIKHHSIKHQQQSSRTARRRARLGRGAPAILRQRLNNVM